MNASSYLMWPLVLGNILPGAGNNSKMKSLTTLNQYTHSNNNQWTSSAGWGSIDARLKQLFAGQRQRQRQHQGQGPNTKLERGHLWCPLKKISRWLSIFIIWQTYKIGTPYFNLPLMLECYFSEQRFQSKIYLQLYNLEWIFNSEHME